MMKRLNIESVEDKTRDDIVPYYYALINGHYPDSEVVRINKLILSKWKPSGLIYIKEKAWKEVYKEKKRIAESLANVSMN